MSDMPDKIIARPMMGTQPQGETHKSGPWSIDDPYANGKLYVSADLPPTREQIMADPRVMALVEAAREAIIWDNHPDLWVDDLQDAYDAITDNEGETE